MSLFTNLLQLLFPERDTARKVKELAPIHLNTLYHIRKHEGFYALSHFRDPDIRACIHELKYHKNKKAQHLLTSLLTRYLEEQMSEHILLIPIPLSKKRERERGYNQVELIVESVTQNHSHTLQNIKTYPNGLIRTRHTIPQTKLSKHEREQNLKGAFSISDNMKKQNIIQNTHILLLDDVLTTGTTLREAKAALSPHHPTSITCVALAH